MFENPTATDHLMLFPHGTEVAPKEYYLLYPRSTWGRPQRFMVKQPRQGVRIHRSLIVLISGQPTEGIFNGEPMVS